MSKPFDRPLTIVVNVLVATVALFCVYLFPMYLVGHWFAPAGLTLAIAGVAGCVLWFTWLRPITATTQSNDPDLNDPDLKGTVLDEA